MRPTVLTIAGSDSSGGAGIQADLKAIEANGGYAATALTAVTAQNTRGVLRSFTLPPELVREQIEAVFDDLDVAAVKSGMLASAAIVREVARALSAHPPKPFVLDPVLVATSGDELFPAASLEELKQRLFPLATLVTPNVPEARALSGLAIESVAEAERAARRLMEQGARAVLVKGGHLEREPATDVLVTPEGSRTYRGDFIGTRHTHGTGCILSAALATQLALGLSLAEAVAVAKEFVTAAIRHGLAAGRGLFPDPLFVLRPQRDLAVAPAARRR